MRSGKPVCIIGKTVRTELFGATDPVGKRMRVGATSCSVIGVLAEKGQSSFGQDQDDTVLAPIRLVQRTLSRQHGRPVDLPVGGERRRDGRRPA